MSKQKQKSNLCTQHVLTRNSMNNMSSYCGLVDARISASDKDLPVLILIGLYQLTDRGTGTSRRGTSLFSKKTKMQAPLFNVILR